MNHEDKNAPRNNVSLKEYAFILLFACVGWSGCEKFVEVDVPKSELITESVFENPGTANSAVLSILSNINGASTSLTYGIALHTGLYGDEFTNYSSTTSQIALYRNNIGPEIEVFFPLQYWREGYRNIYFINSAIEGCSGSKSLDETLKMQLVGESKFARAFWYYNLVNLFGDVPIITSTDWTGNNVAKRRDQAEVYDQIVTDLLAAKAALKPNYVGGDGSTGSAERVRPNSSAAAALLARTYLFNGEWAKAESEASLVLDNKTLYDTVPLNQVFLKNSKESILQISPNTLATNQSTLEARNFVIVANPTRAAISPSLLAAFETGDKRRDNWIGKFTSTALVDYFFPNKYKERQIAVATEYSVLLRVAELYLIRAEARLKQNNATGCRDDLNVLRKRAGLSAFTTIDTTELLKLLIRERQIELFSENGHRWFDMKRYGIADDIMKSVAVDKGGTWADYKKLWPIPRSEINVNPQLKQNTGYPL